MIDAIFPCPLFDTVFQLHLLLFCMPPLFVPNPLTCGITVGPSSQETLDLTDLPSFVC